MLVIKWREPHVNGVILYKKSYKLKFKHMNNSNSNIVITRGQILVELVREGLKEAADTAQIRQSVTKNYPAVQASTSLSSGLFPSRLFGEGQSFTHDRVAFVDIPKNMSKEDAQLELDKYPESCIYKIFSYDVLDVMTATQIQAMENGFSGKDLAFYQEKYAVLDSDKEVVLEDGKILFSSSNFMNEAKEDVNLRGESADSANVSRISINEEAAPAVTEITASKEAAM